MLERERLGERKTDWTRLRLRPAHELLLWEAIWEHVTGWRRMERRGAGPDDPWRLEWDRSRGLPLRWLLVCVVVGVVLCGLLMFYLGGV